MSARTKTKSVLDAEIKRLRTLLGMSTGGGGILPLSRTSFVDGGAASGSSQNGSIAEPYHTIQAGLTALAPTGASVADNTAFREILVTPSLLGYPENLTVPAYRTIEIRMLCQSPDEPPYCLDGNVVWHNTAAAGGAHAPPFCLLNVHNLSITGSFTVTDDVVTSELSFSGDVLGGVLAGVLDLSGATNVLVVTAVNYDLIGGITSRTGAGGADVGVSIGTLGGVVTCTSVQTNLAAVTASAINVGAGDGTILFATDFTEATVITGTGVFTGGTGTLLNFDGPTYRSFIEAGGTVVTCSVIVVGGYAGAAVEGANLTNADVNVSLNGVGASGGFTAGGNHYTLPAGTLTGNHAVTLKTGGGELPGDVIRITRTDATANTYTVKNNAGTTLGAALPASHTGFIEARFSGGDWVFAGGGVI